MFKNILYTTGLVAAVAPAFAALEWSTDLDAATARAATEGKAVLVDFTGSDWCGFCIRLKKNVLDKPEFEAFAKDKFLFVEVDVPRNIAKIGEELYAKNQQLCEKFKIQGFPTIMVLTPEQYIVGGFSGGDNLESSKVKLTKALANAEKVKAAQKLQGTEKAKLLAEVHNSLDYSLKGSNTVMVKAIAEADVDNVTGMKDQAKADAQMDDLMNKLNATQGNAELALSIIDKAIETAYPANRHEMMGIKSEILVAIVNQKLGEAKTVEDVKAAHSIMQEALNLLPEDTRKVIQPRVDKEFADPAALLKKVQQMRSKK